MIGGKAGRKIHNAYGFNYTAKKLKVKRFI